MPKLLPGNLSLNSYMGFAVRWGGYKVVLAGFIENGIRFAIPLSMYFAYETGGAIGTAIREFDLNDLDQELENVPDLLNPEVGGLE